MRGRRSDRSSCEKSTPANGSDRSSIVRRASVGSCALRSVRVRQAGALDDQRADDVDDQRDRRAARAPRTSARRPAWRRLPGNCWPAAPPACSPARTATRLIWLALPTSIASAIVSPSARPNARTMPPKMPRDAVGRITARIVSHRVAPRPYAAMRSFGGTETSASRLIAVIVGRIMIDSTITAGSTPGPLRSVPKSGNPSQFQVQPVAERPDQRNDDEQSPQPVDDAGNRGQQLDQVLEQALELIGQLRPDRMQVQVRRAAAARRPPGRGSPRSGRSRRRRRTRCRAPARAPRCRACPRSRRGCRSARCSDPTRGRSGSRSRTAGSPARPTPRSAATMNATSPTVKSANAKQSAAEGAIDERAGGRSAPARSRPAATPKSASGGQQRVRRGRSVA